MWAMLDENDELVGGLPLKIFRREREAFSYQDGGETYNVPSNWAQTWSIAEINARHIFPLITVNRIDKKVERQAGDTTFTFDGMEVKENIPTEPLPLPIYKVHRLADLAVNMRAETYQDLNVDVAGNDYTFEVTDLIRQLASDTVTALNSGMVFPANYKWATKDGQLLAITESQAKNLARLMLEQAYHAQRKYWERQAEIEAAISSAEVDAIVWV